MRDTPSSRFHFSPKPFLIFPPPFFPLFPLLFFFHFVRCFPSFLSFPLLLLLGLFVLLGLQESGEDGNVGRCWEKLEEAGGETAGGWEGRAGIGGREIGWGGEGAWIE